MEVAEIRDLDGPNLFALLPTIKLEVVVAPDETLPTDNQARVAQFLSRDAPEDSLDALADLIRELHRRTGLTSGNVEIHQLDLDHHVAICYPWEWRSCAMAIAQAAVDIVIGIADDRVIEVLEHALATDRANDDTPTWVRDKDRKIPTAAITGTNGKTTTTRLLAHIVREAGYSVGWSSSSGVYINGVQVIKGDYTGHGGTRRVLLDPDVEVAVLENARGGILQRGLGYESNDVGVFLNVSADHLHLHGVTRLETLANAKATVLRTTREGGLAVLNADDALVYAQRDAVKAEIVLISQNLANPAIRDHAARGGRSVISDGDSIIFAVGESQSRIMNLADIPLTYGGAARHMVENVLSACAASMGLGIGPAVLSDALRSFRPDVEHNAGRLNVFELDDKIVVVDFAHNEIGLIELVDFSRRLFGDAVRLSAIIGTAGDREDSVLVGLGRIAGERADRIYIKANQGYLRGREADEMIDLMRQGIREARAETRLAGIYPSEFTATFAALGEADAGDVIVMMCVEEYLEIIDALLQRGAKPPPRSGVNPV
jgi:cyanophycin synthetase